ncbi:MAG: slipin family protein [Gammaproteobacteria bacterium]|nr:slipin family protein [Gammaproteobacteria bacterium]
MYGIKRVVIARHERGVYLKDRSIQKILQPGVYTVFDLLGRVDVQVYNLTTPEFTHPYEDVLLKEQRALCELTFSVVELGEYQVGLVYKNDKLAGVLAPATRQLYWKGPVSVRVEVIDIATDYAVAKHLAGLFANARKLPAEALNAVLKVEVADNYLGLLIVDGALAKTLSPGLYVFWKFNRSIKVELVDRRVQAVDVSGQEILTADKVSLRINLTALFQVSDPVLARTALSNYSDYLYRELQLALRQVIGTRGLDVLLANKDELDQAIFAVVSNKLQDVGVVLRSVGLKDVILPGEMKEILNQVVQAEKAAQANVIKRREETAATRSLLNTARLMDENPTLMRLKELEVLEKVTEKIDKLTVFGGLEGILKDTVRINVKAD